MNESKKHSPTQFEHFVLLAPKIEQPENECFEQSVSGPNRAESIACIDPLSLKVPKDESFNELLSPITSGHQTNFQRPNLAESIPCIEPLLVPKKEQLDDLFTPSVQRPNLAESHSFIKPLLIPKEEPSDDTFSPSTNLAESPSFIEPLLIPKEEPSDDQPLVLSPSGQAAPNQLFLCTLCRQQFATRPKYAAHSKWHQRRPFRCVRCQLTFTNRSETLLHLRTHAHTCAHCRRSFANRPELLRHQPIHLADRPHRCRRCPRAFRIRTALHNHIARQHRYRCAHCPQAFAQLSAHDVHQRLQHGVVVFRCEYCPAICGSLMELLQHERTHLAYHCALCGDRFATEQLLHGHLRSHGADGASALRLITAGAPRARRKTTQSGEQTYRCAICTKNFRYRNSWQRHNARFHASDEAEAAEAAQVLRCELCPKVFRRQWHLSTHMKRHFIEKPFGCAICAKDYRLEVSLKRHNELFHGAKADGSTAAAAERTFSCDQCPKVFQSKGILKRHMIVHSSEKPFVCAICAKDFRHKVCLTQHIRRCHDADKAAGEVGKKGTRAHRSKHQCADCSLQFVRHRELLKHRRQTHPSQFSCAHCPRTFAKEGYLRLHVCNAMNG